MNRAFTIAAATLKESLRSPSALIGGLLLLVLIPGLTFAGGTDEGTRVWLSRTLLGEGMRLLLPLGAALGGAWLLQVALKRGWAALPARRTEWFIGVALAGLAMIVLCAAMLTAGALLTTWLIGGAAQVAETRLPDEYYRVTGATKSVATPGQRLWISPVNGDRLVFKLNSQKDKSIDGLLTFDLALTGDSAPDRDIPFDVYVVESDADTSVDLAARHKADVHAEARKRVSFHDENVGPAALVVIVPRDKALMIGMYAQDCRITTARVWPIESALWLCLQGLAAGALCLGLALMVRSLSTSPTAALASLLLFFALTLLPGLAANDQMWRAHAARTGGATGDDSSAQKFSEFLASLPPLCDADSFNAFFNGRTVNADALPGTLWRLFVGLSFLPLGALLFTRRQIT